MLLPLRFKGYVMLVACFAITSCGGNGCKYPDEIAAGGIWSETQTTVVKPINRNVISSETGNGEYTLKDDTTEEMADSNLWVPLRSADGTYAKVEAGKKVKLSVSGSVVLAGYSYNTDITFKDWIPYGEPPYSFAAITKRTAIDEKEVKIVKIKKSRTFYQNGLQKITYSYYGEDGVERVDEGELVKIGCDLNLSEEKTEKEKIEDNLYINYAFLYPEKIVFSDNFFLTYTTDDKKHINGTTKINTITIDGSNNLTASVEKLGAGNYVYIYNFEYNGKKYRYQRRLAPEKIVKTLDYTSDATKQQKSICYDFDEQLIAVDCEYTTDNSCILSKIVCGHHIRENGFDGCKQSDRTFIPAAGLSPVKIYFKKYNDKAVGYESIGTNYDYSNIGTVTNPRTKYEKYFYSPVYGLKNRISVSTNEYKNRFSYGLYQTGDSSSDNVKYPGNCRMFPSSISYNPKKLKEDIRFLFEDTLSTNSDVQDHLNQAVIFDKCLPTLTWTLSNGNTITDNNATKIISVREFCSKHCIDICTHYFFAQSDFCNMDHGSGALPDSAFSTWDEMSHFMRYSPIGNTSTTVSKYNTNCTCSNTQHFVQELYNKNNNLQIDKDASGRNSLPNLRAQINSVCSSGATGQLWGGMIYQRDDTGNDYTGIQKFKDSNDSEINIRNFTIGKIGYGKYVDNPHKYMTDECVSNIWDTDPDGEYYHYILTNICSPYDRLSGTCGVAGNADAKESRYEQCADGNANCSKIGIFKDFVNNSTTPAKNTHYCPEYCNYIKNYIDDGYLQTTPTTTSNFDVFARINYSIYPTRDSEGNARKSSNVSDQDNAIYYSVNNENDIKITGYGTIKDGSLAVGGPDVVGITCNDGEIPELKEPGLFTATSEYTEANGDFSGCKVKGKYTSMETTNDLSKHLYYNEQKQGILPIKWSTFTAHPGDILPLSITSADSGASPLLVKTNNCLSQTNNKNCYTQLRNGNGLIIVLEPVLAGSTSTAVDEDMYKNPNLWLCHYGVGGSYGSYIPYLYNEDAITEIAGVSLDIENPRNIMTTTALSWQCDSKIVSYWFTGYDYKGIKLKTKQENSDYVDTLLDENTDNKYPSPHIYELSELNRMIPDYGREDLDDIIGTPIDCSADGTPSSITVSGVDYTKTSNQLSLIKRKNDYIYQYYDGTNLMTKPISGVDKATYPTDAPTRIIIKTTERDEVNNTDVNKNETIFKETNELARTTCTDGETGKDFCYTYKIKYTGNYAQDEIHNLPECVCADTGTGGKCSAGVERICSYEKRVYDESILGAYCADDESDLTKDVTKSHIISSVSTDSCGDSCKIVDNTASEKEIFTAYGPFAGMNADNKNAIMPAIYDSYHACRGGDDEKQFIYDTQKGPNANSIFNILTLGMASLDDGVERRPLDVYWRLEFTNPTLENKSSYKGSYNTVDTTCPAIRNMAPDIMFVDLTNTNEWPSIANGRIYPQTVLLYKNINNIIKKDKIYYKITYSPWEWSEQLLPEDDYRILAIGETCGLHDNCGDGETPDLKIINNSEVKTLVNSTEYPSAGNATISQETKSTYEFYYNGYTYTIPDKKVAETTKICNITNQQAWLSVLTTVGEKMAIDRDGNPLGNLGRAPFIIGCDNSANVKEKYKYGYTSLKNLSLGTTNGNDVKALHETIDDGIISFSNREDAFVMKTQNKSFLSSPYFAHCTTNWQTPGWMLLNNPGDFSSFNIADNALSGSFIAKPNQSLTWGEIKQKYSLEQIWAKHGGIIRNTVYNNICDEVKVPEATSDTCTGNCGKMYTNCKTTSNEQHTPEFTTFYSAQMIAIKTLANDPINTTDTNCEIIVKDGTDSLGSVNIQANEPFGQVMSTAKITNIDLQEELDDDDDDDDESPYNNNSITINGGLKHKNSFFKRTEFYRNLIGAGIVKPEWHFLTNTSTGQPVVIEKGKRIKIEPSTDTFYAMGNLSHQGQAYCWTKNKENTAGGLFYGAIGALAGVCVGVSVASGGLASGTCSLAVGGMEVAEIALVESAKNGSKHSGTMTPISSGNVSKRQCGTGMAFRIVEVPTFACIKGYGFACTSDRLTQAYVSSTTMEQDILNNCFSSTSTDYSSNVTIGTCYRHKTNILSNLNEDKTPLAYNGSRYKMNSFKEVKSTDLWSEVENIDEEQCGLCLPKNDIETYNGINYYTGTNYPTIPTTVRNIAQCNSYQDNEGNQYTFVTSLARITPLNQYAITERENIQNDINNILSTEIKSCTSNGSDNYNINFSNKDNKEAFENIFQKMSIRNENSCIALLETFYLKEIKQANVSEECENAISTNLNTIAKNGCTKLLTYIETKDGKTYDLYKFNVNQTYTYCKDDKEIADTSNAPITSITRVNGSSDSLKQYLFAELTQDSSTQSNDAESVTEINVHMPDKIKINGTEQTYEKANVGFAIAGAKNDNPMLMYSNFKLDNQADLNRGYNIRIGNGIVSRNGKYLYYYIQPNDANGNADPLFEPNTHFNLHAINPHGKQYVKNYPSTHTSGDNMIEILSDPTIHHFADEDVDGDGNITFTAPDSGTLWFAVLDVDEIDPTTGDSISNERDGKAIIFRDQLDLKVNNTTKNVLGTNGGYYMVKGKIQSESFDIMDEMLSMDGSGGDWITKKIFMNLIIKPIRKLLFGVSDFKNLTYENILSDKADEYEIIWKRYDEMKKDEIDKLTEEQKKEKEQADTIHNLNENLKDGFLFQILKNFLSFHLVHILYYMAVVGCMFIFGGKVLLGMQKIDFKTIFNYVLKFSLIALVLHPNALKLYIIIVVKTAFAMSDGFITMVASNFTDRVYVADDSSTALSVAFGPVDSVMRFWIKSERIEQLLAILCSSWFGWVSVLVLLLGTVHFLLSAIQALVVYIITLMNLFLELMLGPIYFVLVLFEQKWDKFTKWLKNIGALIAQQTAMFSALAIFATIYYHVLKGTLNFTYCWEPIIKIPVLNIPLFSCWRIAGNLPVAMAEMMGDYAPTGKAITGATGFSPLTALCLYLLTVTMSKFIDKSVKFGGDLFDGGSQTAQAISGAIGGAKDGANSVAGYIAKRVPKKVAGTIGKNLDKITRGSVEQAINHFENKWSK